MEPWFRKVATCISNSHEQARSCASTAHPMNSFRYPCLLALWQVSNAALSLLGLQFQVPNAPGVMLQDLDCTVIEACIHSVPTPPCTHLPCTHLHAQPQLLCLGRDSARTCYGRQAFKKEVGARRWCYSLATRLHVGPPQRTLLWHPWSTGLYPPLTLSPRDFPWSNTCVRFLQLVTFQSKQRSKVTINVILCAPKIPGQYQSVWRMV